MNIQTRSQQNIIKGTRFEENIIHGGQDKNEECIIFYPRKYDRNEKATRVKQSYNSYYDQGDCRENQ